MTIPFQWPNISPQLAPNTQDELTQQAIQQALQAFQQRGQQKAQREGRALQKRGQNIDMFIALTRVEPSLLETETGKGLLRDAGVDPEEVLTARGRRIERERVGTEEALGSVPPEAQGGVRALIALAGVAPDLPADVRGDIYKRVIGDTGDPEKFNKFLSTWRTGVLTAQQAATAVGIPLPPGIPADLKTHIVEPSQARDRELSRISRTMQGFNTLIDNADRDLQKEHERIRQQIGGAFYKRTGQFSSQSEANKAEILFQRYQQRKYPKYQNWQQQIGKLQEDLTAALEGRPAAPARQKSSSSPNNDELDRLIDDAIRRRRAQRPQ